MKFPQNENWSKFLGYQGWVEILMITLVSSQKSLPPNISAASVPSMPSISFSFFNSYRNFADENGIIQEFSTRIPLRKQLISDLVGQLGSYHACSSF